MFPELEWLLIVWRRTEAAVPANTGTYGERCVTEPRQGRPRNGIEKRSEIRERPVGFEDLLPSRFLGLAL